MENSSISETGERNNTLQILRGLAITAVLLHHTISKTGGGSVLKGIDDILICFHMPAFFIIAGYLYQIKLDKYEKAGKISFIKGKAKHLLIPYAFWTILLWGGVNLANKAGSSVSRMLTEIGFGPMSVKDLAIGLLTYEENYYYTEHLWFLYVLFLFFFIHCLMGKRGKGKISLLLGLAAGFLTCYVDMPNIAERFMLWIVFFIFGRYMAYEEKLKYWIDNKSKNMWILFVLLFALLSGVRLCLAVSNFGINKYIMIFIRQTVKYLLGFLGVLLLYIFSGFAEKNIKKLSDIFKCVGDYSYDIYLMHNPYILALSCVVLNSFLGINAVITGIVSTLLGIAVPMGASKLIIRKFKHLSAIMLGR